MKEKFPIFGNNENMIFLDSAASAQKPLCVVEAMSNFMKKDYANIHRGFYDLSVKSTAKYEKARKVVADFINADEKEIVFTRNATESINLVANTWGRQNLKKNDEVIISILEHHANIVPWQMLEKEIGIKIKVIPCDEAGQLDFDAFQQLINQRTKLLSITAMSNSLGVCPKVEEFINYARLQNSDIKVLVDGCQAVVHFDQDVKDLDCDFFVFSGHKLYGPTGIGVLYGKYEILNNMPVYQTGGDMIKTVSLTDGTSFQDAPARFEAGTPAITEAIGLARAIEFLKEIELDRIEEDSLTLYAKDELEKIDGVHIIGKNQLGIISFVCDWGNIQDIATLLAEQNVCVRVGHHCNMPLMDFLNIYGTIRISFGIYNEYQDIKEFIFALLKVKKLLNS